MRQLLVFLGVCVLAAGALKCRRQTALPTLNKATETECPVGCEYCVRHTILRGASVQVENHCGCGDSATLLGALLNCKEEGSFPYALADASVTKTCCKGELCNAPDVLPAAPQQPADATVAPLPSSSSSTKLALLATTALLLL